MTRRLLTLALAIVALLSLAAVPATADPGVGGGGDGRQYYIETQVRVSGSGHKSGGQVHMPPDFDPPKCWWEPKFTYQEMVDWLTGIQKVFTNFPIIGDLVDYIVNQLLAEYKQYENEPGKIFWLLTDDKTPEGAACYQRTEPKWRVILQVPVQENDQVIDPWDLAKIARANLTLPEPVITINPPDGRSYVGLETWIGVQPVEPLSVTAEVAGFPQLRATITARPSRVEIKTNGPGQVKDGPTCPPYHKGASLASGCWIKYSKSSLGGRYTITVTQHWTVTSEPAFNLPPGEVATTARIQVDEIQATVRK
ncbi:hypothetical protein [Thermoactinospora rubra]|uniref:hypothetical protein n=1 Tax=Thermoactinospora rubra TaxID=1088767 RepID=UPI000A0F5CD7|nr:hypothetical protein [Thermoactinospora rubra]